MNNEYDLELCVMSCLLQEPKLMEKLRVSDKHFKKHGRLWTFLNVFYGQFHNFDLAIMYHVCKDKWMLVNYLETLVSASPITVHFEMYQDLLIEETLKSKKEEYIKENIFKLANLLYVGTIDSEIFKRDAKKIYEDAEKYDKALKNIEK